MESDLEKLKTTLNNCISPMKETRETAEKLIQELMKNNLKEFCRVSSLFLKSSDKKTLNDTCCIYMQIFFRNKFQNNHTEDIPEFLYEFLDILIQIALSKKQRNQQKQISILIGELLLTMNQENIVINKEIEGKLWTDLFVLLNALKPTLKYDAGQIVQSSGPRLVEAFKKTDSDDHQLGILIGETIAEMCMTIDGASLTPFAKFISGLLRKDEIFEGDPSLFDNMLNILAEIVDNEPLMIKEILSLCLKDLNKFIRHPKLSFKQKYSYLGILSDAHCAINSDENQGLKEKEENKNKVKLLIDHLAQLMYMMHIQFGDSWITTEENSDEEKLILEPLDIIDNLLDKFKYCGCLEVISSGAEILISKGSEDKRYLFIAFMFLSQVGEYIENILEISPIVNITLENCENKDPTIRYSCFHCLGQLTFDLTPKFQSNYGESSISYILVGVGDKVLKVKIHAFAALTNFLNGASINDITFLIPNIFKTLENNLEYDQYQVQKLCLNNIKLLAKICKLEFAPYLKDLLKKLLDKAHNTIDCTNNKQLEIHMLYIETAASLMRDVPCQITEQFEPKIMSLLMANQDSLKSFEDPRWPILFDCWISILEFIKKIPIGARNSVLKIIDAGIKTIIGLQDSVKEENEIKIGELNFDILRKSLDLLSKLVSNLVDKNVRISATQALPHLLNCIKQSGMDSSRVIIRELAKVILKVTIFSCTLEIDPQVICRKIESMCEVIALVPEKTFTSKEINENYKTIMQILSKLKIETITLKKPKGEEDSDGEEEKKEDDKDKEAPVEPSVITPDELVYVTIGNLISALCKFHKTESLDISKHILHNFALKILNVTPPKFYSASMQKFSLNILVDYIDNYKFYQLKKKEGDIFNYLIMACFSPHWIVKHAAVTGLGSFAVGLGEDFLKYTKETFDVLFDIQNQKIVQDEGILKNLREILLNTWGKILQILYKNIDNPMEEPIMKENTYIWVHSLPVDFEPSESKPQIQLLLHLIENYFDFLVEDKLKYFDHLIKILMYYYQSKQGGDKINQKIEKIIENYSKSEVLKEKLSKMHENMEDEDKKKMEMCVSKGLN